MTSIKISTTALIWLALLGLADAAGPGEPIGMVIQAKGETVLARGGETRPLRVADLLYANDVLTIGGQASFLFCPESKIYTGEPGSTLELAPREVRTQRGGVPAVREARGCSLPQVAIGSESLERAGTVRVRSAGIPEVPLYVGGPVSSTRPRFQWGTIADAERYRLTLRTETGEPIWETETAGEEAAFPGGLPALENGFYDWEVAALREERTIAEGRTRFEVVPDPEMAALAEENSLPAALELEDRGFLSEAAAVYRKIRSESPADGRFDRHLAWLYLRAGLVAAVEADTGKAH